MYQHVTHRASYNALADMLKEFFALTISRSELHTFKSQLARYYGETYKKLLAKVLSGQLLHVDETALKLKNGKVYIWVFTNLEEVVFLSRPTREGDFLKKLLKDFKGVLVSDFYAAYDAIAHGGVNLQPEVVPHPTERPPRDIARSVAPPVEGVAEMNIQADGGRDVGFEEFLVDQRGRRG
jgi:hypothetical protein